jgi:hypothetical protein
MKMALLTTVFFFWLSQKLFKMKSIFKMAILRFIISPSEPCIFAIFKPKNQKKKLWILIENYITTNETSGFFDKLSISSGIELELGPSHIKDYFNFSSIPELIDNFKIMSTIF